MPKRLVLGLLLAAGLASGAAAQAVSRFDGQYVGRLTLAETLSGDCTEPPHGALYPLTISGGRVEFKYVPRFNTTLVGRVAADGRFRASRRLRRGRVSMKGVIDGANLTAQIVSPSCKYDFATAN